MNRIKDYAGFVGWFAGLGYIVLWPVTSAELGAKPLGASIFCQDGSPSILDLLCNSANPVQLPPGLHALGFLSAVFVTIQLLCFAIRRSRRTIRQRADASSPAPLTQTALPLARKQNFRPPLRPVKPRTHFGLRGMPH
jgi:hypothetical protein